MNNKIIKIEDINAPELDIYARLNEAQLKTYYEPNGGIFIAESPNVIERAINGGCEPISFLVEDRHLENQASEILKKYPEVTVYTATFEVLTKLTGFKLTRGMLGAFMRPKMPSVEEICLSGAADNGKNYWTEERSQELRTAEKKQKRRIVVLEDVMNPTNVGAIFRSAAALGIDGVLLTDGCSDPFYRRASRVSMGTVFQIPWGYIPRVSQLGKEQKYAQGIQSESFSYIKMLQNLGFKTVAMALKENSIAIDDPRLLEQEKLAIIMGTEGTGLRDETIDACDSTVMIPMFHGVDSLNVAAASAIAFWELGKVKK